MLATRAFRHPHVATPTETELGIDAVEAVVNPLASTGGIETQTITGGLLTKQVLINRASRNVAGWLHSAAADDVTAPEVSLLSSGSDILNTPTHEVATCHATTDALDRLRALGNLSCLMIDRGRWRRSYPGCIPGAPIRDDLRNRQVYLLADDRLLTSHRRLRIADLTAGDQGVLLEAVHQLGFGHMSPVSHRTHHPGR